MNCAFEDCTYFDDCIATYRADWAQVFDTFYQRRKVHTDAIADMALAHYIEMHDSVADPKFLLQKEIEQSLQQRYLEQFIPVYALVTLHRMPYAEARDLGEQQVRILQALDDGIDRVEALKWDLAAHLIHQLPQYHVSQLTSQPARPPDRT